MINITRHNLPQNRLENVNGSQNNGSCKSIETEQLRVGESLTTRHVCAGKSVLNDGVTPGINTSNPIWASELFTLNGTRGTIRLSFEVDSKNHDRMELAVFNCPQMRIHLPSFRVYFDSSFRPNRTNSTLGTFIMESQLMNTSCDHLLVFCVQYNTTQSPTRFINLEILNGISDQVFLGEVTFLKGSGEPCDLTMPIKGNNIIIHVL